MTAGCRVKVLSFIITLSAIERDVCPSGKAFLPAQMNEMKRILHWLIFLEGDGQTIKINKT